MGRSSTGNRVTNFFSSYSNIIMTVIFIATFVNTIELLSSLGITEGRFPFSLFQEKPRLHLRFSPTEKFKATGMILKRISIENSDRQLDEIKIDVQASVQVIEVKLTTNPSVTCFVNIDKISNEKSHFFVSCRPVIKNQIIETTLAIRELSNEKEALVVEATGLYGRYKSVGISAVGTLN